MISATPALEMIIGITPFEEPDAGLVEAVSRAGGLGVLDLGTGDQRARKALLRLRRSAPGPFGVRVGPRCRMKPADLATGRPGPRSEAGPHTVVLGVGSLWQVEDVPPRYRVLVEVTDLEQALEAVRAGAGGLIARGAESGGRVGELSSCVLLQQLRLDIPIWVCGGIGPRTAAASVAGGAAGVVVDSQLALLAESTPAEAAAEALRAMDGSETLVVSGHRLLCHPGGPSVPAGDPETVAAMLGCGDPRTQPLPVGQDGFLAARFAERWGDVGRAVQALKDSVRDAVRDDMPARALLEGSPMSRALGTRLPIAQGPMATVSDQARFADAVADEGGLPFMALALADGERSRTMLEETRAAMDGRPWGVGLLGCAPGYIESAQFDAVRQSKPTHAVIAGGRPSQAEALERVGIRTFLQVPGPKDLRVCLAAGARRFVFQGSESGGHVGRWASFPLWEAQLAVLEDFLSAAGEDAARHLEVFFAGGIHNERSAAMIAALATPLTARGAAVGVLLGTAYLFTEEAVTLRAIRPLFQQRVQAASRTALMRTGPLTVTRCVPSPFSQDPQARQEEHETAPSGRIIPEGLCWAERQRLTARLRVASKGVTTDAAGAPVRVDEERQLADGLFMAGEVAVLRSATTTISALHRSVTDGAAGFLARRAALLRERADRPQGEPPVG
ncbi:nitronate monooxygenase [Streptomyces sp. L2]|uniref:nitronate monooxygenase n=1 Tax=Streptomyces sp. L2 TaxID=2162665 RepID=UPI00322033E3